MPRMQEIKLALLQWYAEHRRDLPWRKSTEPYPVWVSEIMLQQTRVDTVLPYYAQFLEKWPTLEALASADPEMVRAAWSGLGYYRRAQLMLKAAHTLVHDYGGQWPTTAEDLKKLPGFGAYTSGAIASIAFDQAVAAVDGNVLRLIARIDEIEGDVSKGKPNAKVWQVAQVLAETPTSKSKHAGDLTQALIELGALVCTAKSPKCNDCPLVDHCKAYAQNRVNEIPPPRARPKRKSIELTALIASTPEGIVFQQRPPTGILAQLWCPPLLEGDLPADAVMDEAERRWGWTLDGAEEAGRVQHILTHRDLLIRVVRVYARESVPTSRTVLLSELDQLGMPSAASKMLAVGLREEELGKVVLPGRKTIKKSTQNKKTNDRAL